MLTQQERDFLSAFVFEATTDPFHGPATKELHRRGIYYNDLSWLMALYYREQNPGQQGFGGVFHAIAPPCPWMDRKMALGRDTDARIEIELLEQSVSK